MSGDYAEQLRHVNPDTLARSQANVLKAKAAHARLHAAFMAAPRPTEPVKMPPHLMARFT